MKQIHKYILLLILLNGLLLITVFSLSTFTSLKINISEVLVLLPVFSLISIISLIIFFIGETKEADSQTLYILVAVSLKFLMELIFALIWFIVIKKTALPSVLMFFVLYLTLTLFTLGVILKTLKNKAL